MHTWKLTALLSIVAILTALLAPRLYRAAQPPAPLVTFAQPTARDAFLLGTAVVASSPVAPEELDAFMAGCEECGRG